jgi:hypothetical protein
MAESISFKPCVFDIVKWPPNRHHRQQNGRGFSASDRRLRKCFVLGCTRGCPRTINRPCPCRCAPCGNTRQGAAGPSLFRLRKSVPARQSANSVRICLWPRRREIDVVLVWRLDRWGRSLVDLVVTLKELAELGVSFVSLTEALDLTTPTGRAMAGLLSVFAEFGHEILRERIRAGIAEARLKGKRFGRPLTVGKKAGQIRKLHRAGISKAGIARRLDIGRTSVRRILADL